MCVYNKQHQVLGIMQIKNISICLLMYVCMHILYVSETFSGSSQNRSWQSYVLAVVVGPSFRSTFHVLMQICLLLETHLLMQSRKYVFMEILVLLFIQKLKALN